MPSLFGTQLCRIKWQDRMAQRPSTQQMCFLPKGCWRFPNLLPTKKKQKKRKKYVCNCCFCFYIGKIGKNKVPTTRGKGMCSGFIKFGNLGMENGKVAFFDEGLNSCI